MPIHEIRISKEDLVNAGATLSPGQALELCALPAGATIVSYTDEPASQHVKIVYTTPDDPAPTISIGIG